MKRDAVPVELMSDDYWKSLQKDAEAILRRFDRLRQRMSEVNAGYTDDEV